jgi:hypothetical protein
MKVAIPKHDTETGYLLTLVDVKTLCAGSVVEYLDSASIDGLFDAKYAEYMYYTQLKQRTTAQMSQSPPHYLGSVVLHALHVGTARPANAFVSPQSETCGIVNRLKWPYEAPLRFSRRCSSIPIATLALYHFTG